MDILPISVAVDESTPTAVAKKWSDMDWKEQLRIFLKCTGIFLHPHFKNKITHFSFKNEFTTVYPKEFFSTITGNFILRYTHNHIDVQLDGYYKCSQTYNTHHNLQIEKRIHLEDNSFLNFDVEIIWDDPCVFNYSADKLTHRHPLWFVGRLHEKYTEQWDLLMSLKMIE